MIFDRIKLNKEILALQEKVAELREIIGEQQKRNNDFSKDFSLVNNGKIELEKEVADLKTKIRDQNAGDLLFNAIKAISAPEKKLPDYINRQNQLMGLRGTYQGGSMVSNISDGLFGCLGQTK